MHIVISLVVSFLMLIVGLAIIVALRTRGIDPVGMIARPLSAQTPPTSVVTQ